MYSGADNAFESLVNRRPTPTPVIKGFLEQSLTDDGNTPHPYLVNDPAPQSREKAKPSFTEWFQ
jgi:hypothetical protein